MNIQGEREMCRGSACSQIPKRDLHMQIGFKEVMAKADERKQECSGRPAGFRRVARGLLAAWSHTGKLLVCHEWRICTSVPSTR